MIYCRCGCTWNPRHFTACPKCEGGEEIDPADYEAPFRKCEYCSTELTNGEISDCCEACWRAYR